MLTDSAALLRERGIQVTAQRLAVLRAVAGQPHITADSVADVVRTEIGAISLQSVYDALSLLVAEGLLRRLQPAVTPGPVVAGACGVGSAPWLTAVDDRGYEIDEAEVAYWGRCPDCVVQSRAASHANPLPTGGRRQSQRRNARADVPTTPSSDREKNPAE